MRRVVITGIGIVSSIGNNISEVRDSLFNGKSGMLKNPKYFQDLSYYLLLARFDNEKNRSVVEMIDLKNQKIIHIWEPKINKITILEKVVTSYED